MGKWLNKSEEYKLDAWAKTTRSQYASQVKIYIEFCNEAKVKSFPATEKIILAFIAWRARKVQYDTVCGALSAISAAHSIIKKPLSLHTEQIYLTLKGIRRNSKTGTNKKSPISYEMMHKMKGNILAAKNGIQIWAMISLSWQLLLRKSELLALKVMDIKEWVEQKLLTVYIQSSKTDQLKKGINLPVYCTCPSKICAYCVMRVYLYKMKKKSDERQLFKMTYTTYLCTMREQLVRIGKDPGEFGTHSCRRGGAQWYKSQGYTDSEVQKLGRWSLSSKAFTIYLEHTLQTAKRMANSMSKSEFDPKSLDLDLTKRPQAPPVNR